VNSPASILVGVTNRAVYIKLEGKGSFKNSPSLKEFFREMLGRQFRNFVVDLENCPVMDSTFMGTLAGFALRLREVDSGSLFVRNVNKRNSDLLKNLGLDNLFKIESKAAGEIPGGLVEASHLAPHSPLATRALLDRSEHAECMIEAHEALVDADPENLARFKDVLEYLKQDLRVGSK
ncbi:MAG: STAS domain-containing protein, partial [Verrucomicrobia bacterium]|nr:STAS domain-containing protein [Verrucomicrobiota bacterium]